jgi:AraC-like DNA-binding protein
LLNDEQLALLKEKLTHIMENDKPYLGSTLSLPKLTHKLHISTHELSYIINTGFTDNFFGFVNRYRVEESKRILTTPQYQHLSMVGIAFEAAFNTAFNTAFKKMLGVSPTEFQKSKNT